MAQVTEKKVEKVAARLPAGKVDASGRITFTTPFIAGGPWHPLRAYVCSCEKVLLCYLPTAWPRSTLLELLSLPVGLPEDQDHTKTVKYFWTSDACGFAVAEHARHSHYNGPILIPYVDLESVANEVANVVLGTDSRFPGGDGSALHLVRKAPSVEALRDIPGVELVPEVQNRDGPMVVFDKGGFFKEVVDRYKLEAQDQYIYSVTEVPPARANLLAQEVLEPLGATWPSDAQARMERHLEAMRERSGYGYRRGRRTEDEEADVEV